MFNKEDNKMTNKIDSTEKNLLITYPIDPSILEKVMVSGDISGLTPSERLVYYNAVCQSLKLNPLTRPFEYIEIPEKNGKTKLFLYAKKDATDQLRKLGNISITVLEEKEIGDVYMVRVRATTPDGRTDEDVGTVSIYKEEGSWTTSESGKRFFKSNGQYKKIRCDEYANAILKAHTKAKRRLTLSIRGLGFIDESEIETIKGAKVYTEDTLIERNKSEKIENKNIPDESPRLELKLDDVLHDIREAKTRNELKEVLVIANKSNLALDPNSFDAIKQEKEYWFINNESSDE